MARRNRMLGKVDLLGLNAFGNNPGLNPIWGAAIGGGVAGVTTVALRHSGNVNAMKHPEAFGLAAGLAASGAMYAMKSTRHAAIGGVVGAVLASGLAWLERMLLGPVAVAQAAAIQAVATGAVAATGTAGVGMPMVRNLNGLGMPSVRALNGLGVPTIAARTPPAGTIPGVAGTQMAGVAGTPPVSLLGNMTHQAAQVRGMGGPAVHGLSTAYGATLLGGGR
jgi:hypothetical protein